MAVKANCVHDRGRFSGWPASRVFKAAVPQVACVLFLLFYTSPLLRESDSSKSMELCSNIALAFEDRNIKAWRQRDRSQDAASTKTLLSSRV